MKIRSKKPRTATQNVVLGRADFARISAVEGIRISASMEADFREFDQKNLSPTERRRAISRKYGSKS
jgi:hypothetical protein